MTTYTLIARFNHRHQAQDCARILKGTCGYWLRMVMVFCRTEQERIDIEARMRYIGATNITIISEEA